MTGDGVGEKIVVFGRTSSDIMDNEGGAIRVRLVRDDHDVRAISGNGAGDEVAGFVVILVFCDLELEAASVEVGPKVGDASVIDVFVGSLQAPTFWIFGEIFLHVLVNKLLKVESLITESPDDDIGADAPFFRNIAAGIFEGDVGGIVGVGDPDLRAGGFGEFFAFGGCGFLTAGQQSEKEDDRGQNSHL